MRFAAAILLALPLVSCGSEPEATSSTLPADGATRLRVLVVGGRVTVRTDSAGTMRVEAKGKVDVAAEGSDLVVRGGEDLASLEVTVPAGLDLDLMGRGAEVTVEGAWGRLKVKTMDGAIKVRAAAAGGHIGTVTGAIDVACSQPPETDLGIESDGGDLAVRIPEAFHGGVQVGGAKGKIEIVPHKRQTRMVWDPDETNVKGWVGPVPSQAEIEDPDWKDRPSVIVRTKTGSVRFELN